MGRTQKNTDEEAVIRVYQDTRDKANQIAMRDGIPRIEALATLVDMWEKFDLLNADWGTRLTAALLQAEGPAQITKDAEWREQGGNKCSKRVWGDGRWHCLFEREGKPPQIGKLPKAWEEAITWCKSCDLQKEERKEKLQLKKIIADIEISKEYYNMLVPEGARHDQVWCNLTKLSAGDAVSDPCPHGPKEGSEKWAEENVIPIASCLNNGNNLPCPHLYEMQDISAYELALVRGKINLEKYL